MRLGPAPVVVACAREVLVPAKASNELDLRHHLAALTTTTALLAQGVK